MCLLPTNLFIANSFSADNVTNILAVLWITQIFRFSFSDLIIARKEVLVLILLAIALPLAKLVYSALILLVFIIPRHKFSTLKSRWMSYGLIIVPAAIISVYWAALVSHNHISFDAYDPAFRGAATLAPGADFQGQLNYILANLLYFPRVIFSSIFNPNAFYFHSYIGALGTHQYHHLPTWMWLTTYVIIFYVAIFSEEKAIFKTRQRIILLATFFSGFVFLLATIHLYWDQVGSGFVPFLQGRYLIPLLPLLFITIGDCIKPGISMLKWPLFITVFVINSFSIHQLFKIYFDEPCLIISEAYSGLELSEAGRFKSDNTKVTFSDQNNKTSLEKRNGESAAMLAPKSDYGLSFQYKEVSENDILEFEIWRKGKGGVCVLTGGAAEGKSFMYKVKESVQQDNKGWQKLSYWFQNRSKTKLKDVMFYVYDLSGDTSYFDDVRVRHKRFVEPGK